MLTADIENWNTKKAADPAVTNGRFAPLHGLPVGPVPLPTTRSTPQTARSSRADICRNAASAAGFRLRLGGGVSLRLRFARRFSPSFAPLSPLADRRPEQSFYAASSSTTRESMFNTCVPFWSVAKGDSRCAWPRTTIVGCDYCNDSLMDGKPHCPFRLSFEFDARLDFRQYRPELVRNELFRVFERLPRRMGYINIPLPQKQ